MKRITFGTTLQDLYGKDEYPNHVEVGRCYWTFFATCMNPEICEKTNSHWLKIKITYIRSGVAFYTICGYENEIPENALFLTSIRAAQLEPVELDPIKELPHLFDNERQYKLYRFDDDRTVIVNYDNEDKEVEE